MIVRLTMAIALWIATTIALRIGLIEPGIGAILLVVAFLIAFGLLVLRGLAFAADLITGI
jgi:hypothetical protein